MCNIAISREGSPISNYNALFCSQDQLDGNHFAKVGFNVSIISPFANLVCSFVHNPKSSKGFKNLQFFSIPLVTIILKCEDLMDIHVVFNKIGI